FGRLFVANPDLPHRLAEGLPLADFDASTLFGGGEHGYTDYPTWQDTDETAQCLETGEPTESGS
ncbi:MAG: hypothetical protein ABI228_01850, partial [Burkholderiaceae bacterium]